VILFKWGTWSSDKFSNRKTDFAKSKLMTQHRSGHGALVYKKKAVVSRRNKEAHQKAAYRVPKELGCNGSEKKPAPSHPSRKDKSRKRLGKGKKIYKHSEELGGESSKELRQQEPIHPPHSQKKGIANGVNGCKKHLI